MELLGMIAAVLLTMATLLAVLYLVGYVKNVTPGNSTEERAFSSGMGQFTILILVTAIVTLATATMSLHVKLTDLQSRGLASGCLIAVYDSKSMTTTLMFKSETKKEAESNAKHH